MFAFLIALVVFAVTGVGVTAWLRRQPAYNNDLPQGLAYLAGLRWADFIRLVLRAMHARGYSTIDEDGRPSDGLTADGRDILLMRGKERTLLSCKHGSASIVSTQAILGLGKSAQLRGAGAAIVVTPGRFEEEARRVASLQQIELIDGEHLWTEVKPFIPEQMLPDNEAKAGNVNSPLLAWAGAAVLAGLAWLLIHSTMAPIEPTPDPAMATTPPAPVAASRVPPNAATGRAAAAAEQVPTDMATLEQRRRTAAETISTLFGVDRAVWSTQSTLLVYLTSADADPITELCPLLERYPELASSRIQLQPPPDSDRPVRFKQCRTY